MKTAVELIKNFLRLEAAGGILLFSMAVLALILSNTPAQPLYDALKATTFTIGFTDWQLRNSVEHWINDGLMVIFFLLVSLEIKREIIAGELNTASKIALPGIAALGGVVLPALIYVFFNYGDATAIKGWGIPVATDIAFAIGILVLLGSRVPLAAKVFLTALAIIDDLVAILIIALFYTQQLSFVALGWSAFFAVLLIALNRAGVRSIFAYCFFGAIMWVFVLKSGIHATIAGVILGLVIPMNKEDTKKSLLHRMEHGLHPWVAFLVLPLFALVNAGLSFAGIQWSHVFSPIPLGIAIGLFVGKQLGIWSACWIAVKLGIAKLPDNMGWSQLYGVALLCGVGFTMSLFIGNLAFAGDGSEYAKLLRIGVFGGSLLSGLAGYLLLFFTSRKSP